MSAFSAYTMIRTKVLDKIRESHLPIMERGIKAAARRIEPTTTAAGIVLAVGVFSWIISGQLTISANNATGAVGHSVGAIIGISVVIATAIKEVINRKRTGALN